MVAFIVSLLLFLSIASAIVAAFAMPQLRAGAPIFTDKGDRLARRAGRPLQPLRDAVWPRLRAIGRPVGRAVRAVARPAARPLLDAVRPRVAPLAQAISRAVEEGSVPVVARPVGVPARGPAAWAPGNAPAGPSSSALRQDGFEALRLRRPVVRQAKRSAA